MSGASVASADPVATAHAGLTAPSIILDLETASEAAASRIRVCLSGLWRELNDCAESFGADQPELVIAYDANDVSEEALAALLESSAEGAGWAASIRLVPAPPGLNYYQTKNFGFRHSSREIAIFVDSDLRLEPGWLSALLEPFGASDILTVVGRTHFEGHSFYERAMSLFWIFDTREAEAVLRPTRRLVSNNIAFRRKLFAAMPFPDRPTYRGQCSELGRLLARFGVQLFEATGARAVHPPPQGLRAFLLRAWHAGTDARYYDRIGGRHVPWRQLLRQDRAALRDRIRDRGAAIGAGRACKMAAHLLGDAYYITKSAGYTLGKMPKDNRHQA
ncbi:glycosyltransferase family 2 protein [Sphingomonas sp. MMS24-J45]|uniref:glycosyltransferase family 2 protein n=1 Tax=Sphingomonas sp. MMS24-J45 TaxID=3238806 RepID=UPI00384C96D0